MWLVAGVFCAVLGVLFLTLGDWGVLLGLLFLGAALAAGTMDR